MEKKLEPLLVSRQEVCDFLGCGLVTLWRFNNDPDFPKPIKITKRKVMYSFEQLKQWVAKKTGDNLEKEEKMEDSRTYEKGFDDALYFKAIKTFGKTNQTIVAIEELSELQKELTKTLRGEMNYDHVVEEIADVEIMLEQLKIMFDINRLDLHRIKNKKQDRLRLRVDARAESKTKIWQAIPKEEVAE